jgi:hypothetical protein
VTKRVAGGSSYFSLSFGIGPQGIGSVGMLFNFAVTLGLTPFTRPPSDEVRALIDTIHEPEGAGTLECGTLLCNMDDLCRDRFGRTELDEVSC